MKLFVSQRNLRCNIRYIFARNNVTIWIQIRAMKLCSSHEKVYILSLLILYDINILCLWDHSRLSYCIYMKEIRTYYITVLVYINYPQEFPKRKCLCALQSHAKRVSQYVIVLNHFLGPHRQVWLCLMVDIIHWKYTA